MAMLLWTKKENNSNKSHHYHNFDEYKKVIGNSDNKTDKLKAYLNKHRIDWKIEFDMIKPESLNENKQLFIDWLYIYSGSI